MLGVVVQRVFRPAQTTRTFGGSAAIDVVATSGLGNANEIWDANHRPITLRRTSRCLPGVAPAPSRAQLPRGLAKAFWPYPHPATVRLRLPAASDWAAR